MDLRGRPQVYDAHVLDLIVQLLGDDTLTVREQPLFEEIFGSLQSLHAAYEDDDEDYDEYEDEDDEDEEYDEDTIPDLIDDDEDSLPDLVEDSDAMPSVVSFDDGMPDLITDDEDDIPDLISDPADNSDFHDLPDLVDDS